MRISSLTKVLIAAFAVCIALAIITPGSPTTYASIPADVSPSPEPNTPVPAPSDTPQPAPSDTPQPAPSNTPQPGPSNTPEPGPSNTAITQPTNTRQTDRDEDRGGVQISVRKTMNTDAPTVGNPIEFTLVVNNTGDETAQDVVVTDPLPAFLQLTGATASRGNVTIAGNTVTVEIGPVGPGETVTIRVTAILLNVPSPPDNRNNALLTTSSEDQEEDNRSSVEIRFPDAGSDADASPTAVRPTDTPLPGVTTTTTTTTTTMPTPPATTTPPIPSSLPPTGNTGGNGGLWLLIALVGATSIACGALLRRRTSNSR